MWKVKSKEVLLDNRWLTVKKEAVDLTNGTSIDDFYSVTIPGCSSDCGCD